MAMALPKVQVANHADHMPMDFQASTDRHDGGRQGLRSGCHQDGPEHGHTLRGRGPLPTGKSDGGFKPSLGFNVPVFPFRLFLSIQTFLDGAELTAMLMRRKEKDGFEAKE
jgi:hypothetical protein